MKTAAEVAALVSSPRRNRQHLRQLSKTEMAEATRHLAAEREKLLASQARRWRRKVARAAITGLLVGVLAGATAARPQESLDTLRTLVHHLR